MEDNKYIDKYETENTTFITFKGCNTVVTIVDKVTNGKININLEEMIEFIDNYKESC